MKGDSLDFWEKTAAKAFWLGLAFVGILGVNTAVSFWKASSHKKGGRSKYYDQSSGESSPLFKKNNKRVSFESDDKKNRERLNSKDKYDHMNTLDMPTNPKRKASADLMKDTRDRVGNILTIAFTGGPCAGKTTAISHCAERLKELGWPVICVPEAATLIFSSGGVLNMETYTPYQGIEFQKCLMKLQISLEDIFTKIVTINNSKQMYIVLCDRGLMDGSAYLNQEQWDVLLNELGLYEADIKDFRYDLVIHLTTAADGATQHYHLDNNNARSEGVQMAIDLDRKIRKAWANHPNYFLINNDVESFSHKIKLAEEYILKTLGYPIHTDFFTKYLVSNKDNMFNRIVEHLNLEVFNITDTFLSEKGTLIEQTMNADAIQKGVDDKVVYIRKREHNSRLTFLKGKRCYTENEASATTKRNIMWKEYVSYIEMYKNKSCTLSRKRAMALIADL